MAAAFTKVKSFVPSGIQCRFRGKWHSKRPDYHKTIERKVFEDITRPLLPEHLVTDPSETCSRIKAKPGNIQEENKYVQFLIRKFKRILQENRMLVACQILGFTRLQLRHMRFDLLDHGIDLVEEENVVVQKAVQGTKWANLNTLLECRFGNVYAFSKEPLIKEFVDVTKDMRLMVPLAGFVDDRMLSREQIIQAAKLPPIDTLRGELLTILDSSASDTSQLLTHHQQMLSMNLEQFIKDQSETSSTQSEPPKE